MAVVLVLSLPAALASAFGGGHGGGSGGGHGGGGIGTGHGSPGGAPGGAGFGPGHGGVGGRHFGATGAHFHRGRVDHFHGHGFHGGFFVGAPWGDAYYPPYPEYVYDTYCNPGSPYYDPRACWAFYDD